MTGMVRKALALGKRYGCRALAVTASTMVLAFAVYGASSGVQDVPVRNSKIMQPSVSAKRADDGQRTEQQKFTVRVVCDGKRVAYLVDGGSVADVLKLAGVELGELDTVSRPLRAQVQSGDVITVTRKDIVTSTEQVVLEHQEKIIYTSLLQEGKQCVLVEGQNGVQLNTYEQMVIDGEHQPKELLSEQVVEKPVTHQVLVGREGEPVSNLDFGYEFDENGEPIGYIDVLRGQRAAGYSARRGAKTASGLDAVVGHVAVDPNVIPYGTKLFICSTDGDFVYGYAIAADTGVAIQNGLIAVDLFYGSYLESALNEIRSVDIFILPDSAEEQ